MRVVHLPFFEDNAYQRLLIDAQGKLGIETIKGGGGGNYFRTALMHWRADILHFHWLHPYIIRPTRLMTLLRSLRLIQELYFLIASGQRVVWTMHNLKNHDNRHPGLEHWFTKRFIGLASAVITHTAQARNEALSAFSTLRPFRVHVVPHGNYIGCYPNKISRMEAREALALPLDSFVFLFLGRIQPYKGVGALIKEFKLLPKGSQLVIAGKPADEEASNIIQSQIGNSSNILFHPGFVADDEIQIYMNACDIVVFPYREVLTSGAVVLAMSFGRACVAPRIGGLTDTLDDRGAIFYNLKEEGGLENALHLALQRAYAVRQMGGHNLELAQQWNWNKVAKMTQRIYETVSVR